MPDSELDANVQKFYEETRRNLQHLLNQFADNTTLSVREWNIRCPKLQHLHRELENINAENFGTKS